MREILFRGKRKNNNEWIEGFVFDDDMVENPKIFIGSLVIEPYKGTADDEWDITGVAFDEVNPETVGQFTGLLDKNGKKIYEGDIVKCNHGITWLIDFELNAFVVKDYSMEIYFALFEQWEYDWKNKKHIPPSPNKFEVIGNIFDNPELLER